VTRRSGRCTNRHGHARRTDSRNDQPSRHGRLRLLLRRRGTQAALIFSVLLFAYLANGEILPGQDATANVRLAAKVVSKRQLVFTPEDEPFMFQWHLKTSEGDQTATFPTWMSLYQGESIRRTYERGDLTKPEPMYYLMPTRFPGVYVNRYGLGAGLFAVPFVAAVYPFSPDIYDRRPRLSCGTPPKWRRHLRWLAVRSSSSLLRWPSCGRARRRGWRWPTASAPASGAQAARHCGSTDRTSSSWP